MGTKLFAKVKKVTIMKRTMAILFMTLSVLAHADPKPHSDWSFTNAGLIPDQSGGRTKPLDSFAREIVLFETGSRSFQGWHPVDMLFSWIAFPEYWEKAPF